VRSCLCSPHFSLATKRQLASLLDCAAMQTCTRRLGCKNKNQLIPSKSKISANPSFKQIVADS
jgi:hypothetical protein